MYFIFLYVIILISSFILHEICCIETSSCFNETETSLNIEKASYCNIKIIAISGDVKTWNSLLKWAVNFETNLEWFFCSLPFFLKSSRNSFDVQNISRKFLMDLVTYFILHSSGNLTELFCWEAFISAGFLINTFHGNWKDILKICQFFQ